MMPLNEFILSYQIATRHGCLTGGGLGSDTFRLTAASRPLPAARDILRAGDGSVARQGAVEDGPPRANASRGSDFIL